MEVPDRDEMLVLVAQALRDDGLNITLYLDHDYIAVRYDPANRVYHTLAVIIVNHHIYVMAAKDIVGESQDWTKIGPLLEHSYGCIPLEDPEAFNKLKDLCHKKGMTKIGRREVPTMKIRVWWIPQIPGELFLTDVEDFVQAKLILDTLTRYDEFQLDHNIKGDYSNAGGVHVFDETDHTDGPTGSWVDWHPNDEEMIVLETLFGGDSELISNLCYTGDPLSEMTIEQVRKFQEACGIPGTGVKK